MRRILCLYLPNWPLQRLLAAPKVGQASRLPSSDPASPILLHARDPRRGLLVVACNPAALACGVRIGMPLAEATTLVGPEAHFASQTSLKRQRSNPDCFAGASGLCVSAPHDPAADLAALARLAEHCERFSPLVGWETAEAEVRGERVLGPDYLLLDITGIGVLFGGEEQLARELTADLSRLGYSGQIGVADTIGAAWAAAQMRSAECGVRNESDNQPATLNLQFAICNSQFAIPDVPLTALRLPEETLHLLAQLGLVQLKDLLALPRAGLTARFGPQVLLRLDQLTGAAQELIVPHRPPPQFQAEWLLEYPLEGRAQIEHIVHELVGRVALALAQRREGVVQLRLRLDCSSDAHKPEALAKQSGLPQGADAPRSPCPVLIEVGLFRPSAAADHLWDLMRMQLDQTRLSGAVGRATLQAVVTAPLENRQGELFAGNRHEAFRQLALLIDRLTSRLGPGAVLRPELTADPLPERAVRYLAGIHSKASERGGLRREKRSEVRGQKQAVLRTKYSVPSTESKSSTRDHSALRAPHSALFRPLALHPPLALDVVSVIPDGPPIIFRFQGQTHRVAQHWGPERIETGWWRGASVRRDYYRVQTEEGLRFWLFRDLADERWHLQGAFSNTLAKEYHGGMAYSSEIADVLTAQLDRLSKLHTHQLAGQVANLEFWLREVKHCQQVIDEYRVRFETMTAAQTNYVRQHDTKVVYPDVAIAPTTPVKPRRVPDDELQSSRSKLREAFYRYLIRAFNERLIDEQLLRDTANTIDLSIASTDLRR